MMVYQLFTSTYTREEAKSVNNQISRLEVTIIRHVSMCHVSATCKITVLPFDLTTNSEFSIVQFLEENRKRSGSYNLHAAKITELNGATGEGTENTAQHKHVTIEGSQEPNESDVELRSFL
jgi:hypothetical protein